MAVEYLSWCNSGSGLRLGSVVELAGRCTKRRAEAAHIYLVSTPRTNTAPVRRGSPQHRQLHRPPPRCSSHRATSRRRTAIAIPRVDPCPTRSPDPSYPRCPTPTHDPAARTLAAAPHAAEVAVVVGAAVRTVAIVVVTRHSPETSQGSTVNPIPLSYWILRLRC